MGKTMAGVPCVLFGLLLGVRLAPGAEVGDPAPELSGTGWAGPGGYTLADLRGKAVALYFYEDG